MAKMVKAIRMILEMDAFGSTSKRGPRIPFGIEIDDDAPKRKPSLEEIDALEVQLFSLYLAFLCSRYSHLLFCYKDHPLEEEN